MAYGDFKNLHRRTASDKALREKAFNIAKYPKHDGYQLGLASVVYKVFDILMLILQVVLLKMILCQTSVLRTQLR